MLIITTVSNMHPIETFDKEILSVIGFLGNIFVSSFKNRRGVRRVVNKYNLPCTLDQFSILWHLFCFLKLGEL